MLQFLRKIFSMMLAFHRTLVRSSRSAKACAEVEGTGIRRRVVEEEGEAGCLGSWLGEVERLDFPVEGEIGLVQSLVEGR